MNICRLKKNVTNNCSGLLLILLLSIHLNNAIAGIDNNAERIFNWAENQFDFFPTHEATQTFDSWRYRFYPITGIYTGVNINEEAVYVLGGPFGNQTVYIDSVKNILPLVLPYELETQQLNDAFTRILQAESDDNLRPETGHWESPEKPGSGLDVHYYGSNMLIIWYTYDEKGLPIWYLASGPFDGGKTWSADLLQFELTPPDNQLNSQSIGSISLNFINYKQALFEWNYNNNTGSEIIEKVVTSVLRPPLDITGIIIDSNDATWGVSTDLQGPVLTVMVYGYDNSGKPRWLYGNKTDADIENSRALLVDLISYTNGAGPNEDYKTSIANSGGSLVLNLDEIALQQDSSVDKASSIETNTLLNNAKRGISALNVDALNFGDQSTFKKNTQQANKFTLANFAPVIHGPEKVAPDSEGHIYSVSFLSDPILDLIPPNYLWQGYINVRHIVNNNSKRTTAAFTTPEDLPRIGALGVKLNFPNSNIPQEAVKIVTITRNDNSNLFIKLLALKEAQRGIASSFGVKIFSGTPPFTYSWAFSDGGTANSGTVTHTFTQLGPAWVEVTVTTNNAGKQIQRSERVDFNVVEGPFKAKITGPDQVNTGETASFIVNDSPTNEVNYIWNSNGEMQCGTSSFCSIKWNSVTFGTVTAQIVDLTGQPVGNLLKKQLQVTAESILIDWITSTPKLNIAEQGSWTVNIEGGDGPYMIRFIFGDGAQTVLPKPATGVVTASHEYNKPGNYQVFATVFDRNGNNASTSKTDIEVESSLSIKIISGPTGLAEFDTGTWVLEVEGADTVNVNVNWGDGKEGTFNNTESIQHFYTQAGTYTIQFTAVGSDGDKKSVTDSVNVFDDAVEHCKTELDPPCESGYVTLEHTGLNGNNNKTINTESIVECEQACNAETEFECKSFDYNPLDDFPTFEDLCVLSDKNRCDNVTFTSSDTHPWSYHERCSAF